MNIFYVVLMVSTINGLVYANGEKKPFKWKRSSGYFKTKSFKADQSEHVTIKQAEYVKIKQKKEECLSKVATELSPDKAPQIVRVNGKLYIDMMDGNLCGITGYNSSDYITGYATDASGNRVQYPQTIRIEAIKYGKGKQVSINRLFSVIRDEKLSPLYMKLITYTN